MSNVNHDDPNFEIVPGVTVRMMRANLDDLFSRMEAEVLTKQSAPKIAIALDQAAKHRRFHAPETEAIANEFRAVQYRYFLSAFLAGYKLAKEQADD